MFRRKILAISLVSGLAIISLGACISAEDQIVDNAEDQIIDRKSFLQVQSQCRAHSSSSDYSVPCVQDVFVLKTSEYCASHELSPANPKCVELQKKVKEKVVDNFVENVKDAYKK
ncbi:MAG: hypothetical protein M3405_08995 [Acidobacteriota bacterium]|jgi:hypothetical protein|nr:hypothetical protein [Acidobacteriota bacterium]